MAKTTVNKIADAQKELAKFKKSLEGKTLKELEAIEQDIIKEADKVDKEVADTKFNLPADNYKKVANGIRYFLNKTSVQWQYSLAMKTIYEFWDPDKKADKIPYATLDTTLRQLGDKQFTGYDEWSNIVIINEYFVPLRNAYVKVTQQVYDIASKHSAVIDALNINDPSKANPSLKK